MKDQNNLVLIVLVGLGFMYFGGMGGSNKAIDVGQALGEQGKSVNPEVWSQLSSIERLGVGFGYALANTPEVQDTGLEGFMSQ